MVEAVTVSVPATTANLGPGFDCLGAALSLHNRFHWKCMPSSAPELQIQVSGVQADRVDQSANNLAYKAFLKLFQVIEQSPPRVRLAVELGVPLARGLGSSATAIVGGLLAANVLAGSPLSEAELMSQAIEMEGHPDNVVPALLGGCCLTVQGCNGAWVVSDVPWHEGVIPVLAVPDFELSTHEARQVVPQQYDRSDAIFNMAHLGLLICALAQGNGEWLKTAMHDRLHQPYRKSLISGYDAVHQAAISAGAWGLVISGAGPTLLALTPPEQVSVVIAAIETAWHSVKINAQVNALALDDQGARIHAD